MICDTDFDELRPARPPARRAAMPTRMAKSPSEACITRWEDDGGRAGIREPGGICADRPRGQDREQRSWR